MRPDVAATGPRVVVKEARGRIEALIKRVIEEASHQAIKRVEKRMNYDALGGGWSLHIAGVGGAVTRDEEYNLFSRSWRKKTTLLSAGVVSGAATQVTET
ncbi:hypothetical protein Pmani_008014 [Petrolisthes manimaculis]|uniref:Uncharacterized protein n=1 Tax=Petrolisthes manimaculis TaxID=1843537 RepID=A0AAE1Q9Q9_9EUCA|nr:hypothetical protein Pmani_008014 [Petrolisthes manimaculis]